MNLIIQGKNFCRNLYEKLNVFSHVTCSMNDTTLLFFFNELFVSSLSWTAVPYQKSEPVRILVPGTDFWIIQN